MSFVNLKQTAEERRQKYWLLKCLGVNASWACKMRDWPLAKIERRFGLDGLRDSFKLDPSGPYAQFLLPGLTPHPHGYAMSSECIDNQLIDGVWCGGSFTDSTLQPAQEAT